MAILSCPIGFKPMIKAHDLNPWQYQKPNLHWQCQKPNSHWQYPKPIFYRHYFIKEPKIINAWQRKRTYHIIIVA